MIVSPIVEWIWLGGGLIAAWPAPTRRQVAVALPRRALSRA
jgi:hypothetical protein